MDERLTLDEAEALAQRVLRANGCDGANARAVAANMVRAERDGALSHGLFRLPGHVALLRAGVANGRAVPSLTRPAPSALIADADLGFAPRTYPLALPALIEAARAQGMAALGIRRCVHFAVLWQEVEVLADAGLVAFAFTSSPPYVAPAGGRRAVFGTNPMAFAWPRPGKPPMVFDQASAAMARGDLQLHAREGRPVPLGVGVDAQGAPSTESRAILDGGAQLPFGGHKGAAIALMVDLLAGPLIDEVTSLESGTSASAGGPQPGGELLLALDPVALGGASGPARAEALFSALEGEPGVRLPGTRRLTERARTQAEGIAVPHALLAEIEALAEGRK